MSNKEYTQLLEARLLDAVYKLAELKFKDLEQQLADYLATMDLNKEEELTILSLEIQKQKDALYEYYGITRQRYGSINKIEE